jgi:hypothetical protein
MTAVIELAGDGTGTCLHTDLIPLQELGRLSVRRASTVEFNPGTQEWEVIPEKCRHLTLFSNQSRQLCLDWERDNFQQLV